MKWEKKSPVNNDSKTYYSQMVELKKVKAKSVRKEGQVKKILKENKDVYRKRGFYVGDEVELRKELDRALSD